MALLNRDLTSYEKEKERFLQELQHFHETRGTPSRRPPKINGHEVDLYMLYTLVTSRGGWVKVNGRNEWDQVLAEFEIPRACVNSAVAIKQIYLRYLDRYEKIHYLGEIGERGADDDEDSRHRRWSARALHSVPLTYNHAQHNVNESLREYNGLSTDLYKPTEYEKLALSLISPLPNEQDFAINVCKLLSNEGKHCLKLEKHPKLLHLLLAHASVFRDATLRALFQEHYGKDRGHSMNHLWADTVLDTSILRLTDESKFPDVSITKNDITELLNKPCSKVEADDQELFCLGRTLGIQDYIGQRVSQVATILRNLTFVNENVPLMGRDLTFLRFVLLCCASNWNGLQQMGWDMLGNVAIEITVQSPLMDDVLLIAMNGLLSQDRAVILASLEVLNKLAQCENNEEILLRTLTQEIYDRVCSFLTLHDIMLLVYTLECLNAISSLGEKACNSILRVRGSLDVLVSLITVEAQSYGPKACIQMRVVETVTGVVGGIVCPPSQQPAVTSTAATSVTSSTSTSSVTTSSTASTPMPSMTTAPTPVMVQSVSSTPLSTVATPVPPAPTPQPAPTPVQTPLSSISTSSTTTSVPARATVLTTPAVTNSAHATQQLSQENEQFALAWLRSTYEPQMNGRVEQAELYKQYINYCAKIGRRGVIAPLHFPRCVRSVFGGSIGPKPASPGENVQQFYEGIQLRAKPLIPQVQNVPPLSAVVQPVAHVPNTPSPILKAQLSAPPKPTPSTPQSPKSQIGGGASPPPGDQGTTSLIKTLLASKVTEPQQLQDQVTQRQQQQQRLMQKQVPQLNSSPKSLFEESSLKVITTQLPTFQSKSNVNCKVNGVRTNNDPLDKRESSNGTPIFLANTFSENNGSRPPPLAPLSSKFNSISSITISNEEIGSASNSVASSIGNRDNCSGTGGEEGDNSIGSLDGFLLNGVPSALDFDDTSSKDSTPKSLMLADLLEKNVERNEPPVLNGSLRIGEKGLELVHGKPDVLLNVSTPSNTIITENTGSSSSTVVNIPLSENSNFNGTELMDTCDDKSRERIKRPSEDNSENGSQSKKPHLNGDVKLEEPPEEGNVSSTAANLYAALAADALEDEPLDDIPPHQLLLTPTPSRQILVTTGSSLTQRVVVSGQHYVVAQPQTALVQGQTQTVLVAQTPQQQGTTAKTIIILQPQNLPGNSQPKVIVQRLQSPPPPPPLLTAQHHHQQTSTIRTVTPPKPVVATATPTPPPLSQNPPKPPVKTVVKQLSPQITSIATSTVPAQPIITTTNQPTSISAVAMPAIPAPCATPVSVTSTSPLPSVIQSHYSNTLVQSNSSTNSGVASSTAKKAEPQGHFLCEWRGCMRNFKSGNEVYLHACESHCPQGSEEIQCLWERCDAMKRKRLSLMTHLQDRHCNPDVMRMMAVRRKQLSVTGRSEIPAPIPAAPHPGYAPNAAFHAIKRHALEFVNPKELQQQRAVKPGPIPVPVQTEQDDNEGPVTKSIRLTAALILRNLVIYSTHGRRHLTRYEPHLASVALSNVESSRTIAHVLFDMSQTR